MSWVGEAFLHMVRGEDLSLSVLQGIELSQDGYYQLSDLGNSFALHALGVVTRWCSTVS